MRGKNQHSKFKQMGQSKSLKRRKSQDRVDTIIQDAFSKDEETLQDIPLSLNNLESEENLDSFNTPSFPEELEVVKAGNEGIRALRKKLKNEYAEGDHPAKNLLINAICKLYQFQRRAKNADGLIKLTGAIRASLLSLEQICGRNREQMKELALSPYANMSDEELARQEQELSMILRGKS